jgi:NCS1 family nucleobase:cation symporter-1
MSTPSATERTALDPLPLADRTLRPAGLLALWWAPGLGLIPIGLGALATGQMLGLGWWDGLVAIAIGTILASVTVALLAAAGARTGLPQLALSRPVFGRTTPLPALLAWLTLLAWAAVYDVVGARAVVQLVGGGFPLWVGGLVLGAGQLVLAIVGFPTLGRYLRAAAIVETLLFLVVTAALWSDADIGIADGPSASPATFVLMVAIATGLQVTWALTASDYARHAAPGVAPRSVVVATAVGLTVPVLWLEALGLAVSRSMVPGMDPVAAFVSLLGGGAAGAVGALATALGMLTIGAMLGYSGSLSALATGSRLPRPLVAGATVVLSLGLAAVLVLQDIQGWLENVLLVAAYWIPAWAAVMLLAAAGRFARPEESGPTRRRWLHRGVNAIGATIAGTVAAALFIGQAIFVGPVAGLVGGADLGYIAGFVVGGALFAVLEVLRTREPKGEAAAADAPAVPATADAPR